MSGFKVNSKKLSGFYRGKVLDSNDPSQLGRVKVEVFGVFNDIDHEKLPWAILANSLFTGAGSGFGAFSTLEVGTYVWCFFEEGDFWQPVVFAEATDGVHGLPTERTTDYPYRKVLKTKNGIVVYIGDKSGSEEIKVEHPSGAYVEIDSSGNITLSGTSVNINP